MSSCIRGAVGVWLSYRSWIHLWWIAFAISVIWNSEHQLFCGFFLARLCLSSEATAGDSGCAAGRSGPALPLPVDETQSAAQICQHHCLLTTSQCWQQSELPLGINQTSLLCLSHYSISSLYMSVHKGERKANFSFAISTSGPNP